jgi:hypothetical protein
MASIERTAYPRFKRQVSARELRDAYALRPDEGDWGRAATRSDEHLRALTVLLKCFERLGYFPSLKDVPAAVVEHLRGQLGLGDAPQVGHESKRTLRQHKELVRERLGVTADAMRAREVAERAIRTAAGVKDNPSDLVTGDNGRVAEHACAALGLPVEGVLSGEELEAMEDSELGRRLPATTVFARVTPEQKSRVIRAQRRLGAEVAFLGDGINDAVALHDADGSRPSAALAAPLGRRERTLRRRAGRWLPIGLPR